MEDLAGKIKSIASSLLVIEEATTMVQEFFNLLNFKIEKYIIANKEEILEKVLASLAPTSFNFAKKGVETLSKAAQLKAKALTVGLKEATNMQEFGKMCFELQNIAPKTTGIEKILGIASKNKELEVWEKMFASPIEEAMRKGGAKIMSDSSKSIKILNAQKIANLKAINFCKNLGNILGVVSIAWDAIDTIKTIKKCNEEGELEKCASFIKEDLQKIQNDKELQKQFLDFKDLYDKYN